MKTHKQGFVWGIAVLVLAILAAGGYFVYKTKTSGPATPASPNGESGFTTLLAPATTSVSADTADWKTYTDAKYGFSFKYPASFSVAPKFPGSKGLIYLTAHIGNNTNFSVTRIADSDQSYQQNLIDNTIYDGSGLNPKSFSDFQKVKLGENEFYFIGAGAFEGVASLHYFLVSKTGIYDFYSSYCCVDWTNPNIDAYNNPGHLVIKQILATLHFTK